MVKWVSGGDGNEGILVKGNFSFTSLFCICLLPLEKQIAEVIGKDLFIRLGQRHAGNENAPIWKDFDHKTYETGFFH